MQVGKLGAAARKTMRPFFVWWVARCFLSVGLWGFGQAARFANVANIQAYTCICICVCLQNLGYSMAYRGIPLAPPMLSQARTCTCTDDSVLHMLRFSNVGLT